MKIDLNHLSTDLGILHHMIADLVGETISLHNQNKSLQDQIKSLQEQLTLLKAKRFGKSSEKLAKQISELEHRIEEAEVSDAASKKDDNEDDDVGAEDTTAESPKNHPKREKLPAHLPREDNVIPPPTICPDCEGTEFRKIADDVSEILEYTPSSFKAIRNIRPRCACTKCERIVQGFPPSQTIANGKAGSGLLAHIILQKYCNHLPFYRQSQMYGYEDIDISRSTMASWAGQCARLLTPLIEAIKKAVFSSLQIHGDDTTIRVRVVALGRKNYLFAGSDNGGDTAAAMYTIIETVKLNNINPWKYLQKVLSVIQDHNSCKIEELLPWNLKLE